MAAKAKQTSRRQQMDVLVGHCLRETQVVGIREAMLWHRGSGIREGGGILIYKIDSLATFDFHVNAS